jgi:hypothetical protein
MNVVEKAKHIAHIASWGKTNVLVVCEDEVTRNNLISKMVEWCKERSWPCHELSSGRFSMLDGTIVEFTFGLVPKHLDGAVVQICYV